MIIRAISYILFGCMSQSGWIWFWSGCWVVRRRVTTSSVITGTTRMPRPPVPSFAPTTLVRRILARKGTKMELAPNNWKPMPHCSLWSSVIPK